MTPIVKAVQGAKDSIVNIHGQKTLSAGEDPSIRGDMPRRVNGMGTGVVIDERGYIITNFHVVDGVQEDRGHDGRRHNYIAQFVVARCPSLTWRSSRSTPPKKLPVITIGTFERSDGRRIGHRRRQRVRLREYGDPRESSAPCTARCKSTTRKGTTT